MRTRTPTERRTQRVILRFPLQAAIDEQPVLILELGLGGAKFEHSAPLPINSWRTLVSGPVALSGTVRYSTMLPSTETVIYHSGIEFSGMSSEQAAAVYDLLLSEARQQVSEWEANLEGQQPFRATSRPRSAALQSYIWLRFLNGRWERIVTTDPNQPLDGVAVPDDTSDEEIQLLCDTYADADDRMRELMRSMATLAILERVRPPRS